jgi:ribosomal protein L25 (general stress protein Ctc)
LPFEARQNNFLTSAASGRYTARPAPGFHRSPALIQHHHPLRHGQETSLKAAPRARTGSGRLKQMRREGWLPSVIYGRGTENSNLKVDAKTFNEVIAHSSSENIIVNLEIEGEGTRLAFLQAIQHDPLSGCRRARRLPRHRQQDRNHRPHPGPLTARLRV